MERRSIIDGQAIKEDTPVTGPKESHGRYLALDKVTKNIVHSTIKHGLTSKDSSVTTRCGAIVAFA